MSASPSAITADSLGSARFRADYGLRYAYLAGSMFKGISSSRLVVAMGRAGLMGFLGTGGLTPERIEAGIHEIRTQLPDGQPYGVNLLANMARPEAEEQAVDVFLRHGVRNVEAAAFVRISPSLVRWRLTGLDTAPDGRIVRPRRILAKVSRPEVAAAFLSPPPENLVRELVAAGRLTEREARLGEHIAMADDICVEADSGGHTDQGVAYTLMPAMTELRERMQARHGYADPVGLGAAGGIGSPQAAAAAFVLGADFVVTGSINQCTPEAGTSDSVKDLLQTLDVQDTTYAPAGDLFELGARVQVARRGLFFPARANRLYELYQRNDSLEAIDPETRRTIEQQYFGRTFEEVWQETRDHYARVDPQALAAMEANPKQRLAMVFRWYFVHCTRLAMRGVEERRVNYQIHCGPAMGAFNQWVRGSQYEHWSDRPVAVVAELIMQGAARHLTDRLAAMTGSAPQTATATAA